MGFKISAPSTLKNKKTTAKVAKFSFAPRVGFEPTTKRLTAAYSTIELPGKSIFNKLPSQDSNLGLGIQSPPCYRYTTRQPSLNPVPKVGFEPTRELPPNSF